MTEDIRALVESWPPLTREQKDRIAVLLQQTEVIAEAVAA